MRYLLYYKLILLSLVSVIMLGQILSKKTLELITPSLIIVAGNILIAFFITRYFTSKQKKDEVGLDHCLQDISEILEHLQKIKEDISSLNKNADNDKKEVVSNFSILKELINMLNNYSLVDKEQLKIIKGILANFEENITGTKIIADEWYDNHLKLKRHLLITKSSVSKKFRD